MSQYKINVKAQIDKESLAKIRKDLENVGKGVTISLPKIDSSSVTKLSSSVNAYSKAISNAEKATKKTSQSFSDIVTKVGKFSLATTAIGNATQIIADIKNEVLEFDKAMIEFTKVSDMSGESLDRYTERLKDLGKEVSRTRTEMLQSATEFKKTGYSEEDSLMLAHTASMFQNIADTQISTAEASKFLVSQMKAFNIEATDSTRIIDAVNEVANNFATGTNDIQSALTKTASAMSTMGNTFEENIGLMIPAMEAMPNSAGKIARGLRSIGLELTNLAKKTGSIKTSLGTINLKDQNDQLKSTFDILTELYPMWQKMSENEKSRIGLLIAGKTQYDVFASTMENFNRAVEAQEIALTSSGSAINENERYMQGMEARLNMLKAEFSDFASKTINSDLTKSLISLSTLFLKLANSDIAQLIIKATVLYGAVTLLNTGFTKLKTISALQPILMSLGTAFIGLTSGALSLNGALQVVTTSFLASPFGMTVAVVAGVTAVIKVVDALTVTFKEQQAIVQDITRDIQDLTSQYENLANKSDLNENDKVKLKLLEAEIQAKEKLLKLEAQELVDKRYATQSYSAGGYTAQSGGIADVQLDVNALSNYQDQLEEVNQKILNLDTNEKNYSETLKKLSEQRDGLVSKTSELTVSLTQEADFLLENKSILGGLSDELESLLTHITDLTSKKIEDNNVTQDAIDANTEYLTSMEELNSRMDELENAYSLITEAQISYAENGYISLDLGRKLTELSGEYISLLFDENGGLVDVDTATRNYTLALIDNMMAKKALEILDTVTQTGAETIAVEELGNAYDSATMSLWDFVVAQNATKDPFTLEILHGQISSLQQLADSMKNAVGQNKILAGSQLRSKNATKQAKTAIDEMTDSLNKSKTALEKHNQELQKQQDEYGKAYKYIESVIDKRTKKLEQQKKQEESYWDRRIDRIKRDQEEVKKQKDAFEKQNQALKDQIDLEERLQALANAENTKELVYTEGQGLGYQANAQAVSDAQKSVDEKQAEIAYQAQLDVFDRQIEAYDEQIENFEKRKERALANLDEEIEHWQDYKNKWKETVDAYDMEQNRLSTIQLFGADVENQILTGRLDIMEQFKTGYAEIQNAIVTNQEEIALIEEELGNLRAKNATDSANAIIRANNAVVESYERMKKMKKSGTVSYSGSSSSKDRKKYATGTIGTTEDEIAIVGDAPNSEMVVPPNYNGVSMALPKNTGVVPATLTENIMDIAKYGMNGLVSKVANVLSNNNDGTAIHIDKISFPNMNNNSSVTDFIQQLSNFKNKAIQTGYKI